MPKLIHQLHATYKDRWEKESKEIKYICICGFTTNDPDVIERHIRQRNQED